MKKEKRTKKKSKERNKERKERKRKQRKDNQRREKENSITNNKSFVSAPQKKIQVPGSNPTRGTIFFLFLVSFFFFWSGGGGGINETIFWRDNVLGRFLMSKKDNLTWKVSNTASNNNNKQQQQQQQQERHIKSDGIEGEVWEDWGSYGRVVFVNQSR